MASRALASGPSSPPSPQGYVGAALPVPEMQEAPGPSPALPSHWAKTFAGEKKEGSGGEAKEKGGKRADLPLGRSGLPNEVKEFIVESFACFQTHKTVHAQVLQRFGLDLDGRLLCSYDPAHRHCRLGKRLRALHATIRKAYIENTAEVAISHQAQRLRLIGQVVEKAQSSKDYAAALKGLELAAKEMGGVLEGRSIVEHRGGMVHVHTNVEDARREVAMRLAQIVDGGLLLPAAVPDNPEISAVPEPPQEGGA